MRIYTRTGDNGSTALFGGDRVPKHHARLEAYGTLDELNSVLGVLRLHTNPDAVPDAQLHQIQHDLFVLGALLATPPDRQDLLGAKMTCPTWTTQAMEQDIDRLTALAPPMRAFVLPGGTPGAAHAHHARTVCRRAERLATSLSEQLDVDPVVVIYLNRLSDWLFALARAENALAGVADIEWVPR